LPVCHHPPVTASAPSSRTTWRPTSTDTLTAVLLAVIVGQPALAGFFDSPAFRAWTTVFVAVCIQALPFLVLGVLLSAAISVLVPTSALHRVLPADRAAAVGVAGLAGAVLPGCECSSVPVVRGLIARGVTPPAALAFLLSAPAINPVVLVATSVAFPGRPEMVLARLVASLAAAVVVGWLWMRLGRDAWTAGRPRPDVTGLGRLDALRVEIRHDFLHAGGFLVVGAAAAATLTMVVPRSVLDAVAARPALSVLALAGLAVLLAICSEADAFVVAGLTQFSLTSRLAFLVVGPMVDVKLVALQIGTFGRAFAARFAPLTFTVAVGCAVLAGQVLL
jgi:uncharacterized protein